MPLKRCSANKKPGWKWGDSGKCYTYSSGNSSSEKAAKRKALNQGIAIGDIDVNSSLRAELSYGQIRDFVQDALKARSPDAYVWVADIYDSSVIYEVESKDGAVHAYFKQDYTINEAGVVSFPGAASKVKRVTTYVAASQADQIPNIEEIYKGLTAIGKPMKRDRIAQLRKAVDLLTKLLIEVDPVIVQGEASLEDLVDLSIDPASGSDRTAVLLIDEDGNIEAEI